MALASSTSLNDIEKSIDSFGNRPENAAANVRVCEIDENGKLSATFEQHSPFDPSHRSTGSTAKLLVPQVSAFGSAGLLQFLISIFLPTGYPHSVTPDYFDYQVYDSLQAFSSSIASLFANRAALSAVGVGDQSATSTSALFMKIIQETVGRLGTIGFAWKFGSALEPECKKYRFMADIVNDSAMLFDCISPWFPFDKKITIVMLCMSGLLRSICGVMAGGSRAALTQHFTDPIKGSIADVSAKDQSQETVISLMGMLAGSVAVAIVTGEGIEMWCVMILLLGLHLWTNYMAVASVVLKTLNRQRTNILFADIFRSLPELKQAASTDIDTERALSKIIHSPRKVSLRENILEPDGILRDGKGTVIGHGSFGGFGPISADLQQNRLALSDFLAVTKEWGYMIWPVLQETGKPIVHICLLAESTDSEKKHQHSEVRAWVHAYLVASALSDSSTQNLAKHNVTSLHPLRVIQGTAETVSLMFDELRITGALEQAGWDLSGQNILTRPVPRIKIDNEGPGF